MIHIKLHDRRPAGANDPMGRDWVGFEPGLSDVELFENNRGRWVLGDRAEDEDYALFSYTGDHTVKFVAEVDALEDFGGKRAIVGRVLDLNHPVAERWVGQPSPDNFRNPTTYFDDSAPASDVRFTAEDCELFEAYADRRAWPAGVPNEDQDRFASIQARLREVAGRTVDAFPGSTRLKVYVSRINPNALTPQDLWICVYPSEATHQSYSVQVGAIIRSDGAEVFFGLGAGEAQISSAERRREAEGYFERTKAALEVIPSDVVAEIEEDLGGVWSFRRSWRADPGESDFKTLSEWIAFAASQEGSGASVSRYLDPGELEEMGTNFGSLVRDLAAKVAPIIDSVATDPEHEPTSEGDEPPYSEFEKALDAVADPIYEEGGGGYRWTPVDEVLASELDLDGPTRCKRASGSGRAANVLTESNDKDIALYLIFVGSGYSRESFLAAAGDRIRRFPNVETVAVADHSGTHWRVRSIVEREGIGRAKKIQPSFPAVADDDVIIVESDITEQADGPQLPTVPVVDSEIFESAMAGAKAELDGLETLGVQLREFAAGNGVVLDATMAADYLAAMLSSQLLFFAGPSGTGKSVSARLLQDFFADEGRAQIFEARRQWLSPDDFVGYYSVLADQFATTPDTDRLIEVHEASIGSLVGENQSGSPPVLVVEEINLSPPEGYLAPFIHGLSGVSTPSLSWNLHSRTSGAIDQGAAIKLPERVQLGPYPRLLGTINVDSTAHAPARKVAARACVLLLEPQHLTKNELEMLGEAGLTQKASEGTPGSAFLGDPMTALRALDSSIQAQLHQALLAIQDDLGGVMISRRDALRALAYMAYFVRLQTNSTPEPEIAKLAAENAILHCVLPTVDADHFVRVLKALNETDLTQPASSNDSVGGVLLPRVERLLDMTTGLGLGFADALDFWSALS